MLKIYKSTIKKRVRAGVELIEEPTLEGELVAKIPDTATDSGSLLMLVECNDEQHQANSSIPDVETLAGRDAVELAAQYQPKRRRRRRGVFGSARRTVEIAAFDLNKFLQERGIGKID